MVASSHYERLGIGRDASQQEIAKAYRALSRRYHPDLNGGRADALRKMQELNESYALLRDPAGRAYDRGFAGHAGAPIRRRRPRKPVPVSPKRRNLGAWLQAAMLAISVFLTFAPEPVSAEAPASISRAAHP